MDPTTSTPVVDLFRRYAQLYQMRNQQSGKLDAAHYAQWKEVSATLDNIFSGVYRLKPDELQTRSATKTTLRQHLPVDILRVPADTDVLCETRRSFFSGKFQDISTGGAYVHSAVKLHEESPIRLTFCTFRDETPLEIDGRVAWVNPRGKRKRTYLEGGGVQFVGCDEPNRRRLRDYVCELLEESLTRANLL
jgi:uncharacterized protein (TIGR02266 family)